MKKYFLILLATALTFGACKKEDKLKELSMIIEGVVFDIETGTPLDGALVTLTTQGESYTDTTDANGNFNLGEFTTGTYVIFAGKPGFTTEYTYASSNSTAVNQKTELTIFSAEIELAPLNQSASFSVLKYYMEDNDVYKIAANVNYEVSWEGLDGKITGKTNGNGLLSVDSLPYKTDVQFKFNFSESGIIYKKVYMLYTGNNISSLNIYGYDANGKLAVTASNILDGKGNGVENFAIDGEINISFSQPLDTNKSVFQIDGNEYDVTWSKNNMWATLIMDPAIDYETTYNFVFNVYNSTSSQYTEGNIGFTTEEEILPSAKIQP